MQICALWCVVCVGDRVIASHSGEHIGRGYVAMTYVTFLIAHRVRDPPCAHSVVHNLYSARLFDRWCIHHNRLSIIAGKAGIAAVSIFPPRWLRRAASYEVLYPHRVLCYLSCSATWLLPCGFLVFDQLAGRRDFGLSARYSLFLIELCLR